MEGREPSIEPARARLPQVQRRTGVGSPGAASQSLRYFRDADEYYRLLSGAEEEDERVRSGAYRFFDNVFKLTLIALSLSVVPAIPSLAWLIFNQFMGISFATPVPDYFVYWGGLSGVLGVLSGLGWLGKAIAKGGHEFTELSREQQLFMTLREAYEALGRYRVTRLPRDRRRAEDALARLRTDEFHPDYHEAHLIIQWRNVGYLAQRFEWIRLTAHTSDILQTFDFLTERVIPRVKEERDLDAVRKILMNLSRFVYSFLPEHASRLDGPALEDLHGAGVTSAIQAHVAAQGLSEIKTASSDAHRGHLNRAFTSVLAGVQSANSLVRFSCWFTVIGGLTAVIAIPLGMAFSLSPSILVPLVVSTPLICAATLTVTTR